MRIQKDSILHFLINLVWTFVLSIPYLVFGQHFFIWLSAYTMLSISVNKELSDWARYGYDMGIKKFLPLAIKDMIFNALGIILGVLAVVGV